MSERSAGERKQVLRPDERRNLASQTQTATPETLDRAPPAGPNHPGRAAGDVDEAREIPTDITTRAPGEPDAVAQGPAAAPTMTDEEAGLSGGRPEGGITPLKRRD